MLKSFSLLSLFIRLIFYLLLGKIRAKNIDFRSPALLKHCKGTAFSSTMQYKVLNICNYS